MLQQPSDFIMYQQKLPLDLNMHTAAEINNLPPDFRDMSLQLQAQRAGAATQGFFFDAYSVQKAAAPQAAPLVAGIQGMYDLPIHSMYNHPIQAIYDPVRHHHQQQLLLHQQQQQRQQIQPQHPPFVTTSGLVPTTPWQPQLPLQQQQLQQQQDSRGSWFPNWQEVFHGFALGKDGGPQEKQIMAPSLEPKSPIRPGDIVAPPVAAMGATMPNAGDAQQPSLRTDTTQQLDPFPLSSSPPHSQFAATLLPQSHSGLEKKRDDNMAISPPISTTGVLAGDGNIRQVCVDVESAQLVDPSPPLPSLSDSTQLVDPSPSLPSLSRSDTTRLPYPALEPDIGRENSLVPCTDLRDPQLLPRMDPMASKYTTQSPSWLPQGWITEVQTRRTGTTAGTRDKYYKDLVSGRRFRSRNEVIHFLQTGKGRLRKRRRKRAIASAFGGHYNLLSHQPRPLAQDATSSPRLFLAPQPIGFLLGSLVNPHPVQSGPNPSSVPGSVVEEMEVPSQSTGVQSTTSSTPALMIGLKQPIEVRPQKLPIQKKAKMLSPTKCEDKQASRLWQWLQKPVARTTEQPERQDADKEGNNEGKDAEDLSKELRIAQRTTQLGKEIDTAQKTIMNLGKEMQATVEKLTREIQRAQRDLRLEMEDATHVSDSAMSNVVEAGCRLDGAMGNVTQATQNLVMAMGLAVQATQLSASKAGAASQFKQPQGATASVTSKVSDMEGVDLIPRVDAGHVAERPDNVMGYSTHASTQPQEVQEAPRPDVAMVHPPTRGCAAQAAEREDLAMGYFVQGHHMPDGAMGYSAKTAQRPDLASGNIRQLVQMPDLAMHYKIQGAQFPEGAMCMPATAHRGPLIVMGSPWTQAAQRSELATGIVDICSTPLSHMGELSKDSRFCTTESFALLKPKLDLSLLSPSLSSRQRAKLVQRMKAKHYRRLLVLLGRELCFKALSKEAMKML